MDLLTVVMHEIGHTLGLGDQPLGAGSAELMAEMLRLGTRRVPAAAAGTGSHWAGPLVAQERAWYPSRLATPGGAIVPMSAPGRGRPAAVLPLDDAYAPVFLGVAVDPPAQSRVRHGQPSYPAVPSATPRPGAQPVVRAAWPTVPVSEEGELPPFGVAVDRDMESNTQSPSVSIAMDLNEVELDVLVGQRRNRRRV